MENFIELRAAVDELSYAYRAKKLCRKHYIPSLPRGQ